MPRHSLINATDFGPNDYFNARIDPVVVHTIELLKYKNSLLQNKRRSGPFKSVPKEEREKLPKLSLDAIPVIDGEEAYEQAKLGVGALIFQLGFHSVDQKALDTLTKCALTKLNKVCHIIQILKRRLQEERECAYEKPIIQALEHTNLAPLSLHRFYHGRVLGWREKLIRQCELIQKRTDQVEAKKEDEKEHEALEEDEDHEPELAESVQILKEYRLSEQLMINPTPSEFRSIEKVPFEVAIKNISKPTPRLAKLIQPMPIPGLELEPLPIQPRSIARVSRPSYIISQPKALTSSTQNPIPFDPQLEAMPPKSPVKSTVPQRQTRRRSPGILSDTKAPVSKRGRKM